MKYLNNFNEKKKWHSNIEEIEDEDGDFINDDNYEERYDKAIEESNKMLDDGLYKLWEKYKKYYEDFNIDVREMSENFVEYVIEHAYDAADE